MTQIQLLKIFQKKFKCSIHEITDVKEHPNDLTVEEILIRSSNVGSVLLAKEIGSEKYKNFIKETNLTKNPISN